MRFGLGQADRRLGHGFPHRPRRVGSARHPGAGRLVGHSWPAPPTPMPPACRHLDQQLGAPGVEADLGGGRQDSHQRRPRRRRRRLGVRRRLLGGQTLRSQRLGRYMRIGHQGVGRLQPRQSDKPRITSLRKTQGGSRVTTFTVSATRRGHRPSRWCSGSRHDGVEAADRGRDPAQAERPAVGRARPQRVAAGDGCPDG